MPMGQLIDDFKPLHWLAEGWAVLRDKAHNALTRFRQSPEDQDGSTPGQAWGLLASDMVDNGDRLTVRIEAPGLAKDQIHVEIEKDQLIVTGEKRFEATRREGHVLITERAFGHFRRVLPLPVDVDAARTHAAYKDGVLAIDMPKVGVSERRKIEIG